MSIKISDLLDFSSHLASSTSPSHEPPLSVGTVHHHPPHYIPPGTTHTTTSITGMSHPVSQEAGRVVVKKERRWDEERCPNVVVRNGGTCMPYRNRIKTEKGEYISRGGEDEEEREGRIDNGYIQLQSPQLDTDLSNLTTTEFFTRLLITKRLLRLKKSIQDYHAMALNLDDLMPQTLQGGTFPSLVPTDGSEEPFLGDHFSMYEVGDLPLGDNFMKSDFSSFCDDSTGFQVTDQGYNITNDSWMTRSTPLPPTPEEVVGDVPYPSHIITSQSTSTILFEATPNYAQQSHHASTSFTQHTPSPTYPLTPDSVLSPTSSGHSEELDEVLSYLKDDVSEEAGAYVTPSMMMHEVTLDTFSSFTHDYNMQASSPSPLSPPPPTSSSTPYTPHVSLIPSVPSTSSDSIKDLLMKNTSQTAPAMSTPSKPSSLGINLLKRKADSDNSLEDVSPPTKKLITKSSRKCAPPRAKKGINSISKKERKREQNKTAALRYRQKKKGELGGIELKEFNLEEKNAKLKNTVESLEAEMKYLKELWIEVSHAKNVREHLQKTILSTGTLSNY